jgi:hypothetical protein
MNISEYVQVAGMALLSAPFGYWYWSSWVGSQTERK